MGLKTQRAPRRSGENLMSLSELLSDLGDQLPRLDAHVTGAELYGAPRLSVFRLLSPTEPTLSRVIADLLDPRGSHGQGELFRNSLLEKVDLPPVTIRDIVRVTREVRTTPKNRRIDIVVETPRVVSESRTNRGLVNWRTNSRIIGSTLWAAVGCREARQARLPFRSAGGDRSRPNRTDFLLAEC